jgi:hypothetical protein
MVAAWAMPRPTDDGTLPRPADDGTLPRPTDDGTEDDLSGDVQSPGVPPMPGWPDGRLVRVNSLIRLRALRPENPFDNPAGGVLT